MKTTSPGPASRSWWKSLSRRCPLLLLLAFLVFSACSEEEPVVPSQAASGATPSKSAGASPPETDLPVGVYTAELTKADFKMFSYVPAKQFAARWTLTIEAGQYMLEAPIFRITEDVSAPDATTLEIAATPAPQGAFNCFDESGDRLTGEGQASAAYSFELSGGGLALEAEEEPCGLRGAILERDWTLTDG